MAVTYRNRNTDQEVTYRERRPRLERLPNWDRIDETADDELVPDEDEPQDDEPGDESSEGSGDENLSEGSGDDESADDQDDDGSDSADDQDGDEFDPAEHNVGKVNNHLATADPDEKARVLEAEKAGRARASILDGPHAAR